MKSHTLAHDSSGGVSGLFEGNLLWVDQYDTPFPQLTLVLKEQRIQYSYNLIQFSSNLSKIFPS